MKFWSLCLTLFLLAPPTAQASDCSSLLQARSPGIRLPRELRLSDEAILLGLESEKYSRLLRGLEALFDLIDSAENEGSLDELSKRMSLPVKPEFHEQFKLEQNEFFQDFPEKIESRTRATYVVTSAVMDEHFTSDYQKGLWSFLTRSFANHWKSYADPQEQMTSFARSVFSNPYGRQGLARFFSIPKVRSWVAERDLTFATSLPPLCQALMKNEKISKAHEERLLSFLYASQSMIMKHGQTHHLKPVMDTEIARYLTSAGHFLEMYVPDQSGVFAIMHVLEHVSMGSGLPVSKKEFFNRIVEEAKVLVLPLKAEIAKRPPPKREILIDRDGQSFENRPIDFLRSTPLAPFRQKTKKISSAENELASSDEENSANSALRVFTSFHEDPHPLDQLRAEEIYRFTFLREAEAHSQSVQFGSRALRWLVEHPDLARGFVDALHWGPARTEHQTGIKRLRIRSEFIDTPLYELKTLGAYRGIMLRSGSRWQLLDIVDKDDFARALRIARPLASPSVP